MPFFRIAPERLQFVGLFGIDLLKDDGDYAWYSSSRGRQRVYKADPVIWLDDLGDAGQLGALDIIQVPKEFL